MMYDFPPYRPPSESESILIRVVRGCHWNRCTFCGMYKTTKFEPRPLEDIKKDILKARIIFEDRDTAFLGDSDSLIHPDLGEIIRFLYNAFPSLKRVTSYARASTIHRMDEDRLVQLRDSGLTRLHIGLESGDELTLKSIRKGASIDEMIAGGVKARKLGFEVSEYVLSGIGGMERWQEHAIATADALNIIKPDFIRVRTITIIPGTPLHIKMKKGEYKPPDPVTRLKETHLLLSRLKINTIFLSDHVSNYLWDNTTPVYLGIYGHLPDEKSRMLEKLEETISIAEQLSREGRLRDSNDLMKEGVIVL